MTSTEKQFIWEWVNVTAFNYNVMRWVVVARFAQIKRILSFMLQHIRQFFVSVMKTSRDSMLPRTCEALYWTGVTLKGKD